MVSKPRLSHPDLANSNLTPAEKQRERTRRWLDNEKRNPARAIEIRQRNTDNRRALRKRKREEEENNQEAVPDSTEGNRRHRPKRRRTSTAQTLPGPAGPSNTTHVPPTETLPGPAGSSNTTHVPPSETLPGPAGPSNTTHAPIPIDPVLLNQETSTVTRVLCDVQVTTVDRVLLNQETNTVTRVLCDVEVMTDTPSLIHSPSPSHVQPPSTRALSPLTDLDSRDLATPIIGKQVHELSETVQWSDGSTTVLPCIMKDGINICQEDADAVSLFAAFPESLPQTSTHVVHLRYSDWRNKNRELCDKISVALRNNKAVVIRQVSEPNPATIDLDYLEDRGMSELMRVVVHDAEQRSKDFTYPHQNATLQQFMIDMNDPNKIQCILDVPYLQGGLPLFLSSLDNGIVNGWNQSTVDKPIDEKVHPDNFTVRSWALLHGPAFWTNPHHDSDGGATFVQVETGEKKWGLFTPINEDTINRTNLSQIALNVVDLKRNHANILENWHAEIVTLLPGDMLIQPPGQFHAVYTPVASFATGGHFYNYEQMHLTELSRYIDHKLGRTLTNQTHEHSIATFHRMLINLPRISRRVNLYSRPLIGLCTMVLDCDKYVAAGTQKPKAKAGTTTRAHDIAKTIINTFWGDLKQATKEYRKKEIDGTNSQMHPGQPISREELLSCLHKFTAF